MYMSYTPSEKPMPPFQQNPSGEFRRTLIKLAALAVITVINDNFLYNLFLYPALLILSLFPEGVSNTGYYAMLWIVNDVSVYLIPAVSAYFLFRSDLKQPNPYKKHSTYVPTFSVPLTFFALCFVGSLASLVTDFIAGVIDSLFATGEIPDAMEGALPQVGTIGTYLVFILTVSVAAPICEELIFRKLMLVPLRKHGDGFAIVTTALFFGFTHGNFDQLPYAFVVGLLFGLLAVNSNSVIPTMFLHTVNNLLVTLGSYSVSILGENETTLALENGASWVLNAAFWLGIPSIIAILSSGMCKSDYAFQLSKAEKAKLIFSSPASYMLALGLALMMVDLNGIITGIFATR